MRPSVKVSKWEIGIYKPQIDPCIQSKVILTDSTWKYVDIYLQGLGKKDKSKSEALFYWQQARKFYEASAYLDNISKPLTAYYCFLNATKALLEAKGIPYDLSHGVSGRSDDGRTIIKNEFVRMHPKGVLSGLCRYLNKQIRTSPGQNYEEYNLKDLLYNLPFVHRAYQSTYSNQAELFIPILSPRIVHDKARQKAWLEIMLEAEHSNKSILTRLQGYSRDAYYKDGPGFVMRRNKTFDWCAPRNRPDAVNQTRLENYLRNRRAEMTYIYGTSALWYIKRKDLTSSSLINHSTLPITYAVAHRLSELARYSPQALKHHLEKDTSWLLSEFISKSLVQFIDQISCEITSKQFRATGFRS